MEETPRNRYTLKAFVLGCALSALVVVMSQYSVNIVQGSYLSIDHMPAGGIFLFFVFVGLLVPVSERLCRCLRFSPSELILVYVMILVTSSIVTMGLGSQFLAMLAGPTYFGPEFRWSEVIDKHVHPWFAPRDAEAVKHFFEGLPDDERFPWRAWWKPLAVWVPFLFTLYFVMICSVVMLRRQWVERERLTFPLTALPLAMVQPSRTGGFVRPFFKSHAMWVGFALPFFIGSLNAYQHYHDWAPRFDLVQHVPVVQEIWWLEFRISFPIIGFGYFISSRVAFGLWFFNLLAASLRAIFMSTGVASTENMGSYGAWSPIFKHLGMGAIFVLVVYGLWAARQHLSGVLRKAVGGGTDVRDDDEILSYRVAFWGWIIGVVAMAAWLDASGLPFLVALGFVVLALLIFVGVVRVVAQGGLPTLIAPSVAPSQIVSSIGCGPIGKAGLATLGFTYMWSGDIRTFVMSAAAHGMKLDTEARPRTHRPLFYAMMAAVVIGVIGSSLMILYLAYDRGGMNLNRWYFQGNTKAAFRYIAAKMEAPTDINALGWTCKFIGGAIMLGFMFLQRNFYWWPVHPLGFAIGANGWMNKIWFSVFLAWAIKGGILKYGGGRMFHTCRPFFLGLVLGQYSCAGVWFVVDWITGATGNQVFWI